MTSGPLRVLVTRTEPGASRQANALLAKGLQPVKLPMIEIEPVTFALGKDLPEVVIVLSVHAVRHGAEAIQSWGDAHLWLAVGKATARALEEMGIHATVPERESSEGLLDMPELGQCADKQIAILCGESPRPLLRETLQERGVDVSEYQVYRRLPVKDISDYHEHLSELSAVIVSSVEGLHAFADLWKTHQGLSSVMLCVGSTRIARAAVSRGFKNLRLLETQSGVGLADALADWLSRPHEGIWHESS